MVEKDGIIRGMTTTTEQTMHPERAQGETQPLASAQYMFLALILIGFAALTFWYSMATPPFETPDEVYHYAFVRHIAEGNALPVQAPNVEAPWEQEGSQAPLYYLLVGWLTQGIDQSDFPALSVRNPRANIGDPLFPGNKNFMLYSAVDYPLTGTNLALHVGRWVSLVLGVITLWCTYLTVRLVTPSQPIASVSLEINRRGKELLPLITTLWVAAIPQFAFISASCSNDSLIIAASAATVYWLARLLVKPITNAIKFWEWGVLGLLLGIAALSKLQGLGLVALAGLAILWLAWRRRDWSLLLRAALPVAIPALAVAGWWYARNILLYGDLFGISHLLENNGLRTTPLSWNGLWGELRGLRYSFWGLFGWFNLLLPGWIYGVLDGITLLGLLGLLIQPLVGPVLTQRERVVRALAVTWTVLSLLLLAYWISQATGSQGRLLFPAIGTIIYLLVAGLGGWLQWGSSQLIWRRAQLAVWMMPPLLMVASSLFALAVLYPTAYAAPKSVMALPETATAVEMYYRGSEETADELHLLGLDLPTARYQLGDRVPVTLYLQAETPIQDDYQLFIQLLNEERIEIGNLTSHPGWGRHPTSLWQPGALYAEHYPVLIDKPIDDRSPLLATVYVGFVNPATEESGRFPIKAYDSEGNAVLEPFLGHVAVSPLTQPMLGDFTQNTDEIIALGTQFGNVIQLTDVALPTTAPVGQSATVTVTLQWDAIGTPATEYTTFVHFLDERGEWVTGFDQAPASRFPTQYWRAGDRIISTFAIPVPAGGSIGDSLAEYAVWVGLYEAGSGGTVRLPVTADAGQIAGDGQVLVRDHP